MVPQDQSLYIFQQVVDGVDIRVGQLKALNMSPGDSCVGQSTAPPGLALQVRAMASFSLSAI